MTNTKPTIQHLWEGEMGPPLGPVVDEPEPSYGMLIGGAIAALMVITMVLLLVYVIMHPAEGHHIQQCY